MTSLCYQRQLKEAEETASELLDLLKEWILKRKRTIKILREIASELDEVKENVNIAKVTGYTASILGGMAGVAGIIMTGGLATPLVVGGVVSVVAGTATSAGASIVGSIISKKKIERAQEALDEDKKLVEKIDEKKIKLEKISTTLSSHFHIAPEELFGLFFVLAFARRLTPNNLTLNIGVLLVTAELVTIAVLSRGMGSVGKGMTYALAEISLQGLARIVGSVLAIAVGGLLIVWDIIKLLETVDDMSKGSKTEAAKKLREIADKLEQQTIELERVLEHAEKQGQNLETTIKDRFRKRLKAISKKGCASKQEAEEVFGYLQLLTTSEWQRHFERSGGNLQKFVFEIARVFHLVYKRVQNYMTENDLEEENEMNVILIAHGGINTHLMLPVGIYFPTSFLKGVNLYEPWGCSVDASVVYGIAANSINISNVRYSGQVYKNTSGFLAQEWPSDWNRLRHGDPSMIPTTIFSPVVVGEGAYVELMAIIACLQLESDGFIIPYYTGEGEKDILPFPEVPLYVITTVLGLIGSLTRTHMKLRVAACLSVFDGDIARRTGVITCSQYYVVDPNQPVTMTNTFTAEERRRVRSMTLDDLNKFL